jgi:hypothetical protein
MACETSPLVQHCKLSMPSRFVLRKRQMARRRLIMAPTAIIRNMANGAVLSVEGSIFTVNIILPARGVRNRHHNLMTADALLLPYS